MSNLFSLKDYILMQKFAQEMEAEGEEGTEETAPKTVPDIEQKVEGGLIEAPGKKELLQIPVEYWDQFIVKLDNFNAQIAELRKNNIDIDPIQIIGKRDNGIFIEVQISYNDAKFGSGWQVVGLLEPQIETYDPKTGRVVSVFEKEKPTDVTTEDATEEEKDEEVKSDVTVKTDEGQEVKLKRRYATVRDDKGNPIHPVGDTGQPIMDEFVYSNPVQQLSQDIQVPEYFSKMRPICQEKTCRRDILRVKLFIISRPYTRTAEEKADTEKGVVDKGREFLMVGSSCIWKFIPKISGLSSPVALANMIKNISVALPKFLQSFKKQTNAAGGANKRMNTPDGMRGYFAEFGILTEFFLSKALPILKMYSYSDKYMLKSSEAAIKMCQDDKYDETMTQRIKNYGKELTEDDRALIDNALTWARSIPKEQLKLFPEKYKDLAPEVHSAAKRRIVSNRVQGKKVLRLIKSYKNMVQETKKYDADTLGPIAQDKVNDFIMLEGTIDQGYPKASTFNIIDQLKDAKVKTIYRYRVTETERNGIPEVKDKISRPRVAEWEAEWDAEEALKTDRKIRVTGLVKSYAINPDGVITNLTQVTPVDEEMYSENKEEFDNNLRRQIETYKTKDQKEKEKEDILKQERLKRDEEEKKRFEEERNKMKSRFQRNQDYVDGKTLSGKFKVLNVQEKISRYGKKYKEATIQDVLNDKNLIVWNNINNPNHQIVQELGNVPKGQEVELTGTLKMSAGNNPLLMNAQMGTGATGAPQASPQQAAQAPAAVPAAVPAAQPTRANYKDPDYQQGPFSKVLTVNRTGRRPSGITVEYLDKAKNTILSSLIPFSQKAVLDKLPPVGQEALFTGNIKHSPWQTTIFVNLDVTDIKPTQPAAVTPPSQTAVAPITPTPAKPEVTASDKKVVKKAQFKSIFRLKKEAKKEKKKDKRVGSGTLDTQLLCCGYPENRRKDPYQPNKKCACKKGFICEACKIKKFNDSLLD